MTPDTNDESASDSVIVEVTNTDGYRYYTEMQLENVERYVGRQAVVVEEEAQRVREQHDGEGGIWQRVHPDADEPLGTPFVVTHDDDDNLVTEYEDGRTESVATDF